MKIRRLGYALGAEITGIDLRLIDEAAVNQIRGAWLNHQVLCFRDQSLSKEDLIAFTSRFGSAVDEHENTYGTDTDGAVLVLTNKPLAGIPWDGFRVGETWHSDGSHRQQPNLASFLYARELPDAGGDTMFANQYLAYESLSPGMRGVVERLEAVHDHERVSRLPPVVHPAVKVHSETGRKALYIGARVRQFVGMTEEESKPLLKFLLEQAVRYEFTYRHSWRVNDVVMWDNRCLLHIAPADYDLRRQTRVMWRGSLLAEKTGYIYNPQDASAVSVNGGAR